MAATAGSRAGFRFVSFFALFRLTMSRRRPIFGALAEAWQARWHTEGQARPKPRRVEEGTGQVEKRTTSHKRGDTRTRRQQAGT